MTCVMKPRQIFALSASPEILQFFFHATVIRNDCGHVSKNTCELFGCSNENCQGLMQDRWIKLMVRKIKSNCRIVNTYYK